jgi:hypothetical protein
MPSVPVLSTADDGFVLPGCVPVEPDVLGSRGADEQPTWIRAAAAAPTAPKTTVPWISDFLSEDLIEGSGV